MEKIICGIQQMGIGVPDVQGVWKWYRKFFGTNVRVFEEAADAPLMTRYTGDKVHSRTATLAISMDGGGGFEIWQFTSRPTKKAEFDIQLGDYGLYMCRIKSRNVKETYEYFKANGAEIASELSEGPDGRATFIARDPNGNLFHIVEGDGWFKHTGHPSKCGGVAGSMIGVRNIEASLKLYQDILEYETVVYDVEGTFDDLKGIPGGDKKVRRVLLKHKNARKGPFAPIFGPTQIELVQSLERNDCKRIFENRYWGDWGFIHLCFDVQGMETLQKECEAKGFPFTVDSSDTFDMGEAGGRFSYIEDPDGTWIEFVETHKVPIIKQIGWYINLKKRKPGKRLPRWILSAMGFNKVKD